MRSIRDRSEAALLALLVLGLGGCSSELPAPIPAVHDPKDASPEPRRGGTIQFATFGDVRSVDPANITDGLSPQILQQVFAGLVDYNLEGKIEPDLAERWTVDDDGK